MKMRRGKLITFEGIDGSGKTTQLRLLEQYLAARGFEFISTREPGGTDLGLKIRAALLDGAKGSVEPLAELLLYAADRAHHVRRVIMPALDAGKLVLSDRFYDATTVYQGYARGFDLGLVRYLNDLAAGGIRPDLTLLFDIDVETGWQRTHKRSLENNDSGSQPNRLDQESHDFRRRVREAYLQIAALEPDRFRVIDAAGTIEHSCERMIAEVARLVD